ncbi:MAG: hypothetical protein PHN51_10380 [Candidatus Nanopelagicales bacterium]|nr:hypothetical protein [Candidatus Nanopelagicales bacterium]
MENTSPTSAYVLFYHANCQDGLMASAIALSFLPDAYSVPINYDSHDVSPDDYVLHLGTKVAKENNGVAFTADMKIYFLDFCPKPGQIRAMLNSGYAITVVDHHKSAYQDFCATVGLEGFDDFNPRLAVDAPDLSCDGWKAFAVDGFAYLYCETNSGALMTYKLFQWMTLGLLTPEEAAEEILTVPNYVKWVSDRDLWKFEYPETKAFNSGFTRYRQVHPRMLVGLLTPPKVDEIVATGQALLDHDDAYVAKHAKNSVDVLTVVNKDTRTPIDLVGESGEEGVWKMALYNSNHLASELCDAYFKSQTEIHVMACYTVVSKDKVIYQTRSREGYVCVWIAKSFGGGGHDRACGFTTNLATLLKFLKTGEIAVNLPKD